MKVEQLVPRVHNIEPLLVHNPKVVHKPSATYG